MNSRSWEKYILGWETMMNDDEQQQQITKELWALNDKKVFK